MSKNLYVFGIGVVLAAIPGLILVPGLDVLAWQYLHPEGFYQRIILIALELLTVVPRIWTSFIIWVFLAKIAAEIS